MDMSESSPQENENAPDENDAKLKGDAIGNTLYSERWVLQALIKLSEIEEKDWNESIEEEMCAIWDMTVERDVVHFLVANNFFALLQRVLNCVNNGRCKEIVAGIAANLCCIEEARLALAASDAALSVIELILSQDSLVLIQVTRLLNSCLWDSRLDVATFAGSNTVAIAPASERSDSQRRTVVVKDTTPTVPTEPQPKSTEERPIDCNPWIRLVAQHQNLLMTHLAFFLSSSVNEELLLSSIQLMDTLVSVPDLELVEEFAKTEQVSSGLTEVLRQLLTGNKTPSRRLYKSIELWSRLMGQVVAFPEGRANLGKRGDLLAKCLTKLLILDSGPETLAAGEVSLAEPCLCVLETLPQVKVTSTTFSRLLEALFILHEEAEKLSESDECSSELRSLLHRSLQFVAHQIESSDDLAHLLSHLDRGKQRFLLEQMEDDPDICEKVERCLIAIRTNGLVQ